MLRLSAETSSGDVVRGVSSYCISHYYNSKASPLAVARNLAKHRNNITYTQVCRGFKNVASVRKALAAAAAIKGVKTILAVTGDKAAVSDVSVFELIKSIDKKRFNVAAAVVFTRKNEAGRVAEKAAAGATVFYTQPVFPSNSYKLVAVLKQVSNATISCSVKIGVFIPFPAAVCKSVAKEKPEFITDISFIRELAVAEKKGPLAAYEATVELAKNNIAAALKVAEAVNKSKKSRCRVAGIHFYGLTGRVFGAGKSPVKAQAAQLLRLCWPQKTHSFNKEALFQ